jgi:hypothetical protein
MMADSLKKDFENNFKMYSYTFILAVLTYGFALSNYTLSVDNEIPILADFGMDLGRWGQNLIVFHLFKGHLPYFSLLLSLFFFSLAAVRMSKLFRFESVSAYLFCGLFVTFPQIAYQVVFGMMSGIAGLGILLSVLAIELFTVGLNSKVFTRKIVLLSSGVLISVFTISLYQAFFMVLATLCVILFLQNTFEASFNLKAAIKRLLYMAGLLVVSFVFYYFSVKIICPPMENSSYLSSFVSGDSNNHFFEFLSIWYKNLIGGFYYGERFFAVAGLLSLIVFVRFFMNKKLALVRFLSLFLILLLPFLMSFAITNGYHPPRLYVASNLVFAFVIVFALDYFKINLHIISKTAVVMIVVINVYFITNLFHTANKIYTNDKRTAEKIDNIIQTKYPDFFTTEKNIYFYGYFPYEYHQKFRIEGSEVFGGSIFNWANSADNYRLVNFFKETDIAEYKMIDTKEKLDLVKDSIANMPIWPNHESIRMFNGIVVVKLGQEKGAKLYFE